MKRLLTKEEKRRHLCILQQRNFPRQLRSG